MARVTCELGSKRMVMLPTGLLDFVEKKNTRACQHAFRSATREQIEEEAAFYTVECGNADEARYQIAKLSR